MTVAIHGYRAPLEIRDNSLRIPETEQRAMRMEMAPEFYVQRV